MAGEFGGPVMVGLIGILALAACMSTISAVINTASVLIAKDIVGTAAPKATRERLFVFARRLTVFVGVLSIFIATMDIPNLMFMALTMYDCTVQAFPAVFIGLFWRRMNIQGVAAGFTVGTLFSIVRNLSPQTVAWSGGWSGGMVGLFFNLIIVIVCAFVFKPYHKVDEIFHTVKTYKEIHTKKWI